MSSKIDFTNQISDCIARNSLKSDMIVCCIGAHGEDSVIIMENGERILESDIIRMFSASKSPTLAGKPKIFILQVCRGRNENKVVTLKGYLSPHTNVQYDVPEIQSNGDSFIDISDYIICHSTPPTCKASRDTEKGTWFIQSFCDIINQYKTRMSLQQMCNMVNQTPPDLPNNTSQICEMTLALTKYNIFLEKQK